MNKQILRLADSISRCSFIGGSDARIIMGHDEAALIRLWQEKRGETEPEDLSGNLVVQLGRATEELNRFWFERNTGRQIRDVQRYVKHSAIPWMAATLDGIVDGTEAVFEAKFMLPWSFSEAAAVEKYMAQVQHNMWVTHLRTSVLSIITGGGTSVEITIPTDPLHHSVLVSAEKKFWRGVQSAETPHLINAEPPRPRIEAIRIVDMSSSNSWAEFAALFRSTRDAFLDHERAKGELKALIPDDAREAIGHGVRAKRSRSGAVSVEVLEREAVHAPVEGIRGGAGLRPGQAPGRTPQSGKVAHGSDRHGGTWRRRAELPVRAALERARHCAQDAWAARDCHVTDNHDRSGRRHGQFDHYAGPCLRR